MAKLDEVDKILRYLFGHRCYDCKKVIQKGNYASKMSRHLGDTGVHFCVDCIIKPENGWTTDILTRNAYFEYMGKPKSRVECNDQRANLGYSPISELSWFISHLFN